MNFLPNRYSLPEIEEMELEPSLSVILPVHNAQSTLRYQIDELLDVIPDMTVQFEVVVVDDGSTDFTEDVALELVREYPQLKFTRRSIRGGLDAAVGDALEICDGEIVFVHESGGSVNVGSLVRLWQLRQDDGLVMARTDSARPALDFSVVKRLNNAMKRSTAPVSHGGVQMIRRDAVESISSEPAELRRLRFASLS